MQIHMTYAQLLNIVISEIPNNPMEKPFGITFIAGPGYGKSTIAKMIAEKLGIYVTANDRIRRIIGENGLPENQELLERLAEARTIYMLENRLCVIIDANMQFHWKIACENFRKYNTKLYFVKINCDEEEVLRRIRERKKAFGIDKSVITRVTEEDYYKYKERSANSDFPEELVFYTIDGNCNINKIKNQVNELYKKISHDFK